MRLRQIMSNFVQSYPCFWELDKIGEKKLDKIGHNWTKKKLDKIGLAPPNQSCL